MFFDTHASERRTSSFMAYVCGWMSFALTITAGIAYYVQSIPSFFVTLQQPGVMLGLVIVQFVLVMVLVCCINRMSYVTALLLFVLYAASLGITLSPIFYIYTYTSIATTFLTTAVTFFCMFLYGLLTKSDLTTLGNLLTMTLLGLVVGLVVNMFFKNAQVDYLLSGVGVIVFVLLIAYDTQKIKYIERNMVSGQGMVHKYALIGALTLYLDFINLFLFLLRFLGKRNEK